jgi:hypothetical protein
VGAVAPREQRGDRLDKGPYQPCIKVLIQGDEQRVQECFELPSQPHGDRGRGLRTLCKYGIIHHRNLLRSIGLHQLDGTPGGFLYLHPRHPKIRDDSCLSCFT